MEKFKLKGTGIDTTNLEYKLSRDLDFDYIHTSIESRNEDLVSEWIRGCSSPLITSIGFLDNRSTLIDYLEELGRESIDLLLVDASCDFEKYIETIREEIQVGIIGELGIKNPGTPERLEEIKKFIDFSKVSLDLCPLNFNWPVIDWCLKNDIMILGFNPFGGRFNSSSLIHSFGIQYLLGFSSKYSGLIFLSGSDPYTSHDQSIVLKTDYIGEECTDWKDEYILEKKISKLREQPKEVMKTSIIVDSDIIVPCNLKYNLFSRTEIINTLGKDYEYIAPITKDDNIVDEMRENIIDFIDLIKKPEDIKDKKEWISVVNLKLLRYLKTKTSQAGSLKIGEYASAISVVSIIGEEKKLFRKEKIMEENSYLLYLNEREEFVIRKIKKGSKNL